MQMQFMRKRKSHFTGTTRGRVKNATIRLETALPKHSSATRRGGPRIHEFLSHTYSEWLSAIAIALAGGRDATEDATQLHQASLRQVCREQFTSH